MTPNPRQLDIFLAEKLFGWKVECLNGYYFYHVDPDRTCDVPRFTSDDNWIGWTGMKLVIQKMRERGFICELLGEITGDWHAQFHHVESNTSRQGMGGESMPLAVALAAKAALEAGKPTTREGSR